jgi:hypothetical protein
VTGNQMISFFHPGRDPDPGTLPYSDFESGIGGHPDTSPGSRILRKRFIAIPAEIQDPLLNSCRLMFRYAPARRPAVLYPLVDADLCTVCLTLTVG